MNKIELIKASAGSGKTHHLMDRLSECIASGVRPEELLATTFTVKAAAELQSRIRQKLLENNKPELASQVFDGLIGTVNGVCGRLLNEYAIEAGLSPALDVLPEESADVIFGAAISSVTEKHAEKLEDIADRLSLNPIREDPHNKPSDWKKDVRMILDLARSNGLDGKALEACGERSAETLKKLFPATVSLSLEDIARRLRPYRDFPSETKKTEIVVESVRSFLRSPTWAGAVELTRGECGTNTLFPTNILQDIGNNLMSSRELYEDMCSMIRGVFACAGESLEAYAEYKKALGLVDFTDQECNVLHLLENDPEFVRLMKARLSQIMVDEFQDTSPIQLALFLKLNECSRNGSVWVGDPKQAIYGFRGTDPELMEAVAATIPGYKTLPHSWRSKKKLVDLANAVFKRAFSSMPEQDIVLGIPKKREKKAAGGVIEAWHLVGSSKEKRLAACARGIAELIRDKGVSPGSICVLLRTNDNCRPLAKALEKWNIATSVPSGALKNTVECQLVMSAFRYCIDHSDTAALATLLAFCGNMPDWPEKLRKARADWLARSEEERKNTDYLAEIRNMDFLRGLRKKSDAAPMEILEYAITSLDLDGKISSMAFPDMKMSNLDELRKRCAAYTERALADRSAATPAGFVAALNEPEDPKKRENRAGSGSNTVDVTTYHKSKGLEWPIVILGDLDSQEKSSPFGIFTVPAKTFDPEHPLKGRSIHYWPRPFGEKNFEPLAAALQDDPIQLDVKRRELEEAKRLLYVGLTRACDQVVFSLARKPPTQTALAENPNAPDTLLVAWLDALSKVPVLTFPAAAGPGQLEVGTARFGLETRIFPPDGPVDPLPSPPVFADKERDLSGFAPVPARRAPSGAEADDGTAVLLCRRERRGAVTCPAGKDDLLGNAFHGFFALNPRQDRLETARRILKNWTVEDCLAPETLVECADDLYRWIAETWPGARISCEVPMTYHDENGTLYQGFIDMLLELPASFVIIDHKTYRGTDARAYAAKCAGQLRIYRKSVEAATGKKVAGTVIHFPNLGLFFDVR